jgi:hypothetical protein
MCVPDRCLQIRELLEEIKSFDGPKWQIDAHSERTKRRRRRRRSGDISPSPPSSDSSSSSPPVTPPVKKVFLCYSSCLPASDTLALNELC